MLKKQHRLSRSHDIKKVLGRGKVYQDPNFTLKLLVSPAKKGRFTVVVSTKISKKAVERNRIKRITREVIRSYISQLSGLDGMIIARPGAAKLENPEIRAKIEALLKKI